MAGTREQLDQALCREVGAEVRRLRSDRGWSLAELSVKAHYSVGYLSKIENGKKRVTPAMARGFDEVFDTGGFLIGLLATPEEPIPAADEPEPPDASPCPYPGLAAFGPEEARWFSVGRRSPPIWFAGWMNASAVVGRWRWWPPRGRVNPRCWPLD